MFEKEAEEYVIKKHHIDKTKLPIDFSLRCEFSDDFTDFQKGAVFGYQKGVQELDKKWHDLRKNPKGLPEENQEVLVYFTLPDKSRNSVAIAQFKSNDFDIIDLQDVIAWYEIPTFKE